MNEGAYWLARARVERVVADEGDAVVLHQALSDVELRAVDVLGPEGNSAVLVRWGLDVEPVSGVLTDPDTHRGATSSQLLVLGAALRLCWSDPSRMPYPGVLWPTERSSPRVQCPVRSGCRASPFRAGRRLPIGELFVSCVPSDIWLAIAAMGWSGWGPWWLPGASGTSSSCGVAMAVCPAR